MKRSAFTVVSFVRDTNRMTIIIRHARVRSHIFSVSVYLTLSLSHSVSISISLTQSLSPSIALSLFLISFSARPFLLISLLPPPPPPPPHLPSYPFTKSSIAFLSCLDFRYLCFYQSSVFSLFRFINTFLYLLIFNCSRMHSPVKSYGHLTTERSLCSSSRTCRNLAIVPYHLSPMPLVSF